MLNPNPNTSERLRVQVCNLNPTVYTGDYAGNCARRYHPNKIRGSGYKPEPARGCLYAERPAFHSHAGRGNEKGTRPGTDCAAPTGLKYPVPLSTHRLRSGLRLCRPYRGDAGTPALAFISGSPWFFILRHSTFLFLLTKGLFSPRSLRPLR